jgi:integrase
MATIHKRRLVSGNVVWELCHGSGRDRVRLVAGKTREEAQETLNQFNRQLALHGQAPSDDTVAAILGQYFKYLEANRRAGTRRRYTRVLQTFHRRFLEPCFPAVTRLRQITPAHVEEYKTRRAAGTLTDVVDLDADAKEQALRAEVGTPSGPNRKTNAKFGFLGRKRFKPVIAPRTINYELQVLRTFFRWCVGRNYLSVNPATPVERLRIPKRALPKFLTTEELTRLFAACPEWERRLFMTILMTGMRRGEVQHLTWADINFELGVILIQAKPQWHWTPKTDERVIPISPTLRELLLHHHACRRDGELVFPNRHGNPDPHLLPKLKKIGRKAGLPHVTVHALRHSFGAHLRMAGVNLSDIADLLGHKDLATTAIYAKVHQEHLRTAIAKLTPVVTVTTPAPALPESSESASDAPMPVRALLKS